MSASDHGPGDGHRRRTRLLGAAAVLLVTLYAGALSFRPLNANDLFWHLATGREILRARAVPITDPFSFASDRVPWIDHEWAWQVAAQRVYDEAGARASMGGSGVARDREPTSGPARPDDHGPPHEAGELALILFGVATVVAAFAVAGCGVAAEGVPASAVIVLGLLAAETARERLMVRPETASLFFLGLILVILGRCAPGAQRAKDARAGAEGSDSMRKGLRDAQAWRRGIGLFAVTALWANVHPAALLAPVLVLLHAVGSRWGAAPRGLWEPAPVSRATSAGTGPPPVDAGTDRSPFQAWIVATLATSALAGAGTLVNPYGWRIWTVPFKLATLVKTESFYNPEWLRPPIATFPLFYLALGIAAAAALAAMLGARRLPEGRLLVALAVGTLALQQMRHMGLFAVAFLLAGGSILRALDPRGRATSLLARPVVTMAAFAGALMAIVPAHAPNVHALHAGGLDAGRFPVEACERIAREGSDLRLFNDVQFGGYLVWRFYPPKQVFIDGRNELYADLLGRLGRIQQPDAGAGGGASGSSFQEWKSLLAEYGIDGAIVKDKGEAGMVTFDLPPEAPGGPPRRVRRAFSAVYFPIGDWALVYFDDAAMVFVKRGGRGDAWIGKGEYRALNIEDVAFVLDKSARDPEFAARAREEAERRVHEQPRCEKAEKVLAVLDSLAAIQPNTPADPQR